MAGAVSRTATAPVDRVKMLLQAHDDITPLTVRQGFRQMANEGATPVPVISYLSPPVQTDNDSTCLVLVVTCVRMCRHVQSLLQGQRHKCGQDCS